MYGQPLVASHDAYPEMLLYIKRQKINKGRIRNMDWLVVYN